jgi:hypothetical protein
MTHKVANLNQGDRYLFRILAENNEGLGEPIELTGLIRVSEKAGCPEKVEVTDITDTSVTIAWAKPIHDGGAAIQSYEIDMQTAGFDAWKHYKSVGASVFSLTITGLKHKVFDSVLASVLASETVEIFDVASGLASGLASVVVALGSLFLSVVSFVLDSYRSF